MKPSLQLRFSQQLTMTPQLQQAIKLLQLSSLELQTEIQQALESNPMLEMAEDGDENDDLNLQFDGVDGDNGNGASEHYEREEIAQLSAGSEIETSSHDNAESHDSGDDSTLDASDALSRDTVDHDLPVDAQWEDWDFQPPAGAARNDDDEFDSQGKTSESLQDYLRWQLNLTPFSDTDRAIAEAVIDAIDDDGYLRCSSTELLEGFVGSDVELDEIEAVIHRIQYFDPPGVGARDLGECLLIQLRLQNDQSERFAHATLLVREHLTLLSGRDLKTLMRKSRLSEEAIRAAIALVQTLNPHPGNSVVRDESEYVIPDVLVRKKRDRWVVELNSEASPRLRINSSYASLIQRTRTASDNQFLRNHLQEAKWFIKSLQSRNETLLKVATAIVEQQIGFFEHGEEAMKPMVLAQIAELLGMHESTISRVTTQKFMHTPRGIFELKYFFSSHLSTAGGGEASSTAIRAFIKKLVASEESAKPLSDNQIAELLAKQGYNVARRTVAKYREAMNIPPSSERKSFV